MAWYGHGEHATPEDLAPDLREAARDDAEQREQAIDDWHLAEPPDEDEDTDG